MNEYKGKLLISIFISKCKCIVYLFHSGRQNGVECLWFLSVMNEGLGFYNLYEIKIIEKKSALLYNI